MDPKLGDLFTEPTAEQWTAQILRDECEGLRNHARASYENILSVVWRNPRGLTPQQVFTVLGHRGAAMLKAKELFGAMLAEAFPANPPSDPKPKSAELTVSEDGTVTVSGV